MIKNISLLSICLVICVSASSCKDNNYYDKSDIMAPDIKKEKMTDDGIIRLSKVEVYPQYLDEYMKFAVEVGTKSLQTEPGVLTMYALQDKENPCMITILETYSSQEAYKSHIASEHFQKYKQGTLHMVKNLKLCDQTPLNPSSTITNSVAP